MKSKLLRSLVLLLLLSTVASLLAQASVNPLCAAWQAAQKLNWGKTLSFLRGGSGRMSSANLANWNAAARETGRALAWPSGGMSSGPPGGASVGRSGNGFAPDSGLGSASSWSGGFTGGALAQDAGSSGSAEGNLATAALPPDMGRRMKAVAAQSASLPDHGSTLLFLGAALLGVAGFRRLIRTAGTAH